jgi:hypothetical protein
LEGIKRVCGDSSINRANAKEKLGQLIEQQTAAAPAPQPAAASLTPKEAL